MVYDAGTQMFIPRCNYSTTTINFILEIFRLNMEKKIRITIMEHLKYKRYRYRRKKKLCFGENFANAHPNLPSFISTIRTKFLYY
ncbi:hypothetical protein MXB_3875 [Myxobolus squamalis]|nr:hypothetical protein MXB_3875 [Myxobolus squamalis]